MFLEAERQKAKVEAIVDLHLKGPQQIAERYSPFRNLLSLDPDRFVSEWFEGELDDDSPSTTTADADQEPAVERRKRSWSETREQILHFIKYVFMPAFRRRHPHSSGQVADSGRGYE
jgi:hypothetical protein